MHGNPGPAGDNGKTLAGYIDQVQTDSGLQSLPAENCDLNTDGYLEPGEQSRRQATQCDCDADSERRHTDEHEDDLTHTRQRHRLCSQS